MDILTAYFNDALLDAIKKDHIELSTPSFKYIIKLLTSQNNSLDTLLFNHYKCSIESSGTARFYALKRLGDTSLFLSGFFTKYVETTAGLGYYIDMGCMAYRQASLIDEFAIMHELSDKFCVLVGALNTVSLSTTIGQQQSINQLLELNSRAHDNASVRKLIALHAIPVIGIKE